MKTGLILCLLVALILMICILIILRQYLKLKRSYDAMLASYRNLEELNGTLRMQRHDYLNHLQVIQPQVLHALMEYLGDIGTAKFAVIAFAINQEIQGSLCNLTVCLFVHIDVVL